MSAANSQRLLQHIRRLAADPQRTPSDGELLRSYVAAGDPSAFAALVRRHGAMVFAVCQSVLRQRDDAEDASQAAFLILAQKAASIRRHEGLGGWLQRVAYHIALKARVHNVRRRQHEANAACSRPTASACEDLSWGEVRAILHAELAALPERLRAPLVLCYLEGLTQEEAARQLGWTAATVKGRLQRGRDKLRRRLERRGLGLAAALAAALTGQVLAETAVRLSKPLAMATPAAAALARDFVRPFLSMKLVVLSVVLLSIGVVAGGIALRSPQPKTEGTPPPVAEKPSEPRATVDAHDDPLPDGAIARLGTIHFNHGDGLNALSFTLDGKTMLSEGNGSIRFWDAGNGKEREHIRIAKTPFFDDQTVLLADGNTLITLHQGGEADVAHVWDLTRKTETRTLKLSLKRRVFSVDHQNALSADGKFAVLHVHSPAQAQVFDLTTGKNLYQLADGHKEFLAVAFAGKDRIVSADQKQCIEVWEARSGKLLRQFTHDAPIRFLLASPDGRWLASLDQRPSPYGRNVEQEMVHLWDMGSGTIKHSLRATAKYWFTNLRFAPDGKAVLTSSRRPGGGDEVVLWDRETGRRLLVFDKTSGINADVAAIGPDGSRLAAGNLAGKFELWDLKNGHRLTSEDSRHTRDATVFLSSTGERATIIGHDSISSWDPTTARRLHSFDLPGDTLYSHSRSSDGHYAATFRLEGEEFHILIWDIAAGKRLHTLRFPGGYQQITGVFSPDSSVLATWHPGKQTLVRLWDVRSGKLVRSFEEKKAVWPGKMCFTADGKTLFVAGKNVAAYEVASGKELFSWRLKPLPNTSGVRTGITGVEPQSEENQIGWRTLAVSPDGARVAAILWQDGYPRQPQENRLALYDARSGRLLRRWNDSGIHSNFYEELIFSPDGQLLASSDGTVVHIWEAATSKLIQSFKGHRGDIHALAFSGDDRRLASASNDSTVLIWDLTGQRDKASSLTEAKLKECWNDLAREDAGRAHRAVWTLIRAPGESVPFLKAHLHPVQFVSGEQLDRWIQDLDADAFDVRQKASAVLEKLGEAAEAALRRALDNKPTLEQRRRIEPMLAKLEAAIPSGEALRTIRAVRVLKHIDTAEARHLLREFTKN